MEIVGWDDINMQQLYTVWTCGKREDKSEKDVIHSFECEAQKKRGGDRRINFCSNTCKPKLHPNYTQKPPLPKFKTLKI